jgi:hypothetical protein
MTHCTQCGVTAEDLVARRGIAVLVTHTLKLWRRTVEWVLCGECEIKEMRS